MLKTQGIRSSKPVVDSILQEVRFEQVDLTTSAEDDSKMEASMDHQDIQISRFMSDSMTGCMIPSPNKSVTISRSSVQSPHNPVTEAFKSQIIMGPLKEDCMSCASTDAQSKFDSFVSVAKDVNVTIIKPKQFKPIII